MIKSKMEGPLVAEIIKNHWHCHTTQNGHIGCMKAMHKNRNYWLRDPATCSNISSFNVNSNQ